MTLSPNISCISVSRRLHLPGVHPSLPSTPPAHRIQLPDLSKKSAWYSRSVVHDEMLYERALYWSLVNKTSASRNSSYTGGDLALLAWLSPPGACIKSDDFLRIYEDYDNRAGQH